MFGAAVMYEFSRDAQGLRKIQGSGRRRFCPNHGPFLEWQGTYPI